MPKKKRSVIEKYCAACGKPIHRGGVKRYGYYYHKSCTPKRK